LPPGYVRLISPSALNGVLAQLVERLNGIEEVRGSNPLGSIKPFNAVLPVASRRGKPVGNVSTTSKFTQGRQCFAPAHGRSRSQGIGRFESLRYPPLLSKSENWSQKKREADNNLWRVRSIRKGLATLEKAIEGYPLPSETGIEVAVVELVVVRSFGDPIYPALHRKRLSGLVHFLAG
jgi:hypothetical protein